MERVWHRNSSSRLFENDLLEFVSKAHPALPFAIYLPLALGVTAWGLSTGASTWPWVAVFVPVGLLVWQLMEYGLHRFFFHWEGVGPVSRRVHHVIHGYHHLYPDDAMRLVMPLSASLPLAALVAGLLWFFDAPAATLPVYTGVVLGYLWYDFLHWAVHARPRPRTAWMRRLRAHHMAHHFANPDANFGISHRWLDRVVGTLEARPHR